MRLKQYYAVMDYRTGVCQYRGTSESRAAEAWKPGTVCGKGLNEYVALANAVQLVSDAMRAMGTSGSTVNTN